MKALLIILALLIGGDFAINHGNATHHTLAAVGSFFHWLGNAGSDSIFSH